MAKQGHWAAAAAVDVAIGGKERSWSKKRHTFDPKKLNDPLVIDKINKDLAAIPPLPWSLDATSHTHILNIAIRSSLARHAPPAKLKPTALWMGELSSQLVKG